MKNIVCPVSSERIPGNLPRISAFFVIVLFSLFLLTGYIPIILFLAFDFYVRGFNYPNLSLINFAAKNLVSITNNKSKLIDKAPKTFAARLGFMMSVFILLFSLLNLEALAHSFTVLILFLSFLESAFGFCVGCVIFSWIVLPIYQRKNNFDPTI